MSIFIQWDQAMERILCPELYVKLIREQIVTGEDKQQKQTKTELKCEMNRSNLWTAPLIIFLRPFVHHYLINKYILCTGK